MKSLLICFFTFLMVTAIAQVSENKQTLIPTNDSILKEEFLKPDKDYHVIITYTNWCKPCVAGMPSLIELCSHYDNVEAWFVNPDPLKYSSIIKKYLAKHPEIDTSYILDGSYKGSVKKRLIAFRDKIYPTHTGLVGLPMIFILTRDFQPVDIIVGHDTNRLKLILSGIKNNSLDH